MRNGFIITAQVFIDAVTQVAAADCIGDLLRSGEGIADWRIVGDPVPVGVPDFIAANEGQVFRILDKHKQPVA